MLQKGSIGDACNGIDVVRCSSARRSTGEFSASQHGARPFMRNYSQPCQRSGLSKRNGFSKEFMNLETSENKIDIAPDGVKCARISA